MHEVRDGLDVEKLQRFLSAGHPGSRGVGREKIQFKPQFSLEEWLKINTTEGQSPPQIKGWMSEPEDCQLPDLRARILAWETPSACCLVSTVTIWHPEIPLTIRLEKQPSQQVTESHSGAFSLGLEAVSIF